MMRVKTAIIAAFLLAGVPALAIMLHYPIDSRMQWLTVPVFAGGYCVLAAIFLRMTRPLLPPPPPPPPPVMYRKRGGRVR